MTTCACCSPASASRTTPITGKPLTKQTVEQMVDRTLELPEGTRIQIMAPVVRGRKGEYKKEIEEIRAEGFARARIDGTVYDFSSDTIPDLARYKQHTHRDRGRPAGGEAPLPNPSPRGRGARR